MTTAVVLAISDLAGCDPVDLDICLADHVDPDALNALFGPRTDSDVEVTLQVAGYEVTVRRDGLVTATEPCSSPATCGEVVVDA